MILAMVQSVWRWIRERGAVLRPTWFAALMIGLVALALQHPQARDAIGSITEDEANWWPRFWILVSALALAVAGWYFPRALLYVAYWYTPDDPDGRFAVWRRRVPRLLGVAPLASLALAFAREGKSVHALLTAAIAALLWLSLAFRRPLLRRFTPGLYGIEGDLRLAQPGESMPRKTVKLLSAYVIGSVVLIALFLRSKVWVPQTVGPMGVGLFSVAVLIAIWCVLLVYPANRWRLPSLVLLALLSTGLFGRWNDNHAVRAGRGNEQLPRETASAHLERWLEFRPDVRAATASAPYPVFVVAAEGGGIRAAYWTATVLARLEDEYPGFACHVLAVSGVSGGSLGGAVFSALLADRGLAACVGCASRDGDSAPLSPAVDAILGRDFLGPALAGWLFPDLVQRFLPWPVLPDRAEYLELAWEDAWSSAQPSDRFADDFLELWRAEGARCHVPSLFLNGTWAESGSRVLTSNLIPDSELHRFRRADDMLEFLGRTLPLSTAVHMSARFTWISPAGTIRGARPDGTVETRHVVDGGYFENSGALTAHEIVGVIEDYRASHPNTHIVPIGIFIKNSPRDEPHWPPFLSETLVPLSTLLATRFARGRHAESLFENSVEEFLRFDLQDEQAFPLGWMLSRQARDEIEGRVDPDRVQRVGRLLFR